MHLTPGTRVGPYEILEPLGAGGMGEVYRARDTRLGRDVALKVLPEGLASDPARLARFEREARVLASLNHPNIAAIFGFEPMGGTGALVMELVEGPTLADHLLQGPLPWEDAIAIARQIAEALEVAHDNGIVHRDLKPANVKLRPDGAVKVLDFGLAKALETETSLEKTNLSQSPTISQQMTGVGMILGTAAYMAPEQAKGKAVDRRADIWAFGVVLYEMLTGRQLFQGETVSETLASVMKDEVSWQALTHDLPVHVRALLRRCLTRDPRQRLQSIGEARIILESGAAFEGEGTHSVALSARRVHPVLFAVAAIALGVLGFVTAWTLRSPKPVEPALRKYPLSVHPDAALASMEAIVSPDGRHVAFYAGGKLWVRSLVTLEWRELCTVQGLAMRPAWSPDGEHLAFTDGTRLLRIPLSGGQATPICLTPVAPSGGIGASWGADGRLVFALGAGGLFEVNASGGDAREILPTDSTSSDFHEPLLVPGSNAVSYIRHRRMEGPDTIALFDGTTWRDLVQVPNANLRRPAWSPSGHLLFQRVGGNSGLWALPFSFEKLEATGPPFLVAADGTAPSVTTDGKLLYSRGTEGRALRVMWMDRNGSVTDTLSGPLDDAVDVTLSPDGRRAALISLDGGSRDVWVVDLERHTKSRVTFDRFPDNSPTWSPDGAEIFYTQGALGSAESRLFVTSSRGGGTSREVGPGEQPTISPDGNWIAYVKHNQNTGDDIFIKQLASERDGTPIVDSPSDEIRPEFSPDGRFLVYSAEESGQIEVFITRAPSGEGRWQVSVNGGRRPHWSPNGDRLFFQDAGSTTLLEADVTLGDVPLLGTPRPVLDLTKANVKTWGGSNYDVDAGNERFLVLRYPSSLTEEGDVIVVENWAAEFDK